jgi:hypothetical protein
VNSEALCVFFPLKNNESEPQMNTDNKTLPVMSGQRRIQLPSAIRVGEMDGESAYIIFANKSSLAHGEHDGRKTLLKRIGGKKRALRIIERPFACIAAALGKSP